MMEALWIVLGIVGVIVGSEIAIRSAEAVARRMRIPPLLIGLTLTSVGTSLPEISTNIAAGMSSRAGVDASGLLVGNIVGSCFSQITLLLGLTGLAAPLNKPAGFIRDGVMMFAAALLMLLVCLDQKATPIEGVGLIVTYLVYLGYLIYTTPREAADTNEADPPNGGRVWLEVIKALAGLMVVVFCADVVIDNSVVLARAVGLSEPLIGLGLGIGTGLPELSVALQAVRRQSTDIGLGNLIGSNITDPLISFSAGIVIYTATVPDEVLWFDFPWWLAATAVAMVFIWTREQLARWESALLLVTFFAFFGLRYVLFEG